MRKPQSVRTLEDFGRIQLSPSFFMRDFLYSEISQIEGIPNIPENPDLAIEVGRKLCVEVLEPIQQKFGRISIRSAYRSPKVNAKGAENKNQYNCAANESNYSQHIWDVPDKDGNTGAMACIVVNAFLPYYERTGHWQALAWWIHDNIPGYSSMYFFPPLSAFNIGWHQNTEKSIKSYISPKGTLTKPGMDNHSGNHESEYIEFLRDFKRRKAPRIRDVAMRQYKLLSLAGAVILSDTPGTLGGNSKAKIYGRLDCTAANSALSDGYADHRVFFGTEKDAIKAGYRPCGRCMNQEHEQWKLGPSEGSEYPWINLPAGKL